MTDAKWVYNVFILVNAGYEKRFDLPTRPPPISIMFQQRVVTVLAVVYLGKDISKSLQ